MDDSWPCREFDVSDSVLTIEKLEEALRHSRKHMETGYPSRLMFKIKLDGFKKMTQYEQQLIKLIRSRFGEDAVLI